MKIAFVGTGKIVQRHLDALTTLPDLEIVGHTSPTPAHVDAAVAKWGGRGYSNLDELLDNETVDAVWVTVPPSEHGEIEQRLLENNIPFLVEKPLAIDRQTVDTIEKMVEESNTIVAVGYNFRAMDTITQVRETLTKHTPRLVVGTWHGSTPSTNWWQHQNLSGGQVIEQATHLIDLARFLVGEATFVSSMAATNDRPDYPDSDIADVNSALLDFNGTPAVFSTTCLLRGSSDVGLKLISEGLTINITLGQVTYDYGHEKHEIKTQENSYLNQNRAFIEAVRQNDPSLVYSSYADALKTHHLCLDIVEHSAGT